MNISNIYAELGEGIYIDKSSASIYWVDIVNSMLFVATPFVIVKSYKLSKQVSTVLYVNNNLIYLTSSDGIVIFNVATRSLNLIDNNFSPILESAIVACVCCCISKLVGASQKWRLMASVPNYSWPCVHDDLQDDPVDHSTFRAAV